MKDIYWMEARINAMRKRAQQFYIEQLYAHTQKLPKLEEWETKLWQAERDRLAKRIADHDPALLAPPAPAKLNGLQELAKRIFGL